METQTQEQLEREKEIKSKSFWKSYCNGEIMGILFLTFCIQPSLRAITQMYESRLRVPSFLENNIAPERLTRLETIDSNYDGKKILLLLLMTEQIIYLKLEQTEFLILNQ